MRKLVKVGSLFLLASLLLLGALFMANENFTTFTEVDANSRVTVTADTVTFSGVTSSDDAYVYKDYTADYFAGDFSHDFLVNIGSGTSSFSDLWVWAVANSSAGVFNAVGGNEALTIKVDSSGASPVFQVYEYKGGFSNSTGLTLSFDTDYYCTVAMDDDGGYGDGRVTFSVYSDAGRISLVDSETYDINLGAEDYRYLYAVNIDGSAGTAAGEFGELDIGAEQNDIAITLPLLDVTMGPIGILYPLPLLTPAMTAVVPQMSAEIEIPLLEISGQTGLNATVACELPLLSPVFGSGARAAVALPLLTASANAEVGVKAEAAWTLPLLQVSGETGHQCSMGIPLLSVAATADAEVLAQVVCALPLLKTAFVADVEHTATVAVGLPLLSATATTRQEVKAAASVALPLIKPALSGQAGQLAEVGCTLPMLTIAGALTYSPSADLVFSLPMLAMGGNYYPGMTASQAGRFDSYVLRYTTPA